MQPDHLAKVLGLEPNGGKILALLAVHPNQIVGKAILMKISAHPAATISRVRTRLRSLRAPGRLMVRRGRGYLITQPLSDWINEQMDRPQ